MTRQGKKVLVNLMTGHHPLMGVVVPHRDRFLGRLVRSGHLTARRVPGWSWKDKVRVTTYTLTDRGFQVASRSLGKLDDVSSGAYHRNYKKPESKIQKKRDRYGKMFLPKR